MRSKRFLKAVTHKKETKVPKSVQFLRLNGKKSVSVPRYAKANTFLEVVYVGLKSFVANVQNQ